MNHSIIICGMDEKSLETVLHLQNLVRSETSAVETPAPNSVPFVSSQDVNGSACRKKSHLDVTSYVYLQTHEGFIACNLSTKITNIECLTFPVILCFRGGSANMGGTGAAAAACSSAVSSSSGSVPIRPGGDVAVVPRVPRVAYIGPGASPVEVGEVTCGRLIR